MRTIKFRGKRGSDDKWVYGSFVYSENIEPTIFYDFGEGKVKTLVWCNINPKTVGQFTGLTDKNGQEIYEDDICVWNGTPFKVIWHRPMARYFGVTADGGGWFNIMSEATEDWEVIGNVHDNPELLKEARK